MSNQRPIFNENAGLFGKANRIVMNGILDTVDTVNQYQAAMVAAQRLLLEQRQSLRHFLAKLDTATSLGAGSYRWTYTGKPAVITLVGAEFVNDTADNFTEAINLREFFNGSNPVDGMNPTAPQVSIGAVGSSYVGSNAWSTTDLEALVIMYVTTKKNGDSVYFFDRPNPTRCFEPAFEGGGV